jgi:hypothetical protein
MEDIKNTSSSAFKEWFYLFAQVFKEHYLMISVVSTLLFFVVCMVFNVAYLSEFGLDYFLFGGIYDAYQMAIANYAVIFFLMFLNICAMLLFFVFDVNRKQNYDPNIKKYYLGFLLIMLIALSHFFLSFLGEKSAIKIKNGLSSRYNIYTNDENYHCHAIFGKTAGYFLVWDYQQMRPKILPGGNVKSFELLVSEPPVLLIPPRYPGDIEKKKSELLKAKNEWDFALKTLCNQVVNW